jgi:ubiquinol-cytochrome c reductase iron-sulfur subunit
VKRLWRLVVALVTLVIGRFLRRHHPEGRAAERIVSPAEGNRGAEGVVIALLLASAVCAVAFMVIYGFDRLSNQTQFLGLALGLSLAFLAAALITIGKLVVATEERQEEYPESEHPDEQEAIGKLVAESSAPITRKGLLAAAGGTAGGALLLAALTPALSLGPWLDTDPLYRTPWRRGRRLVDSAGRPWSAADIGQAFYTAYPEGASHREIGSPVVIVRLDPAALHLPPKRAAWAPQGIVAYSKICTHAGCAIALYRQPKFAPTQPRPALICPCHYSTFDPARAAQVIFGPAGRPLPQLPLMIDGRGDLRAAGNLSGPPGPSWEGVRSRGASS